MHLYSTDWRRGLAPGVTQILNFALGVTQMLGLGLGVFAFLDTNMFVSFALGDVKVWHSGSKPTLVLNANGFVSQWNIGFRHTMCYMCIYSSSVTIFIRIR